MISLRTVYTQLVAFGCTVTFGFFSGSIGPLLPHVIIKTLGRDQLGVGYGILLLFEAGGSLLGPPVAGMIHKIHLRQKT